MRPRAACTASASRWSTRCRTISRSRSRAAASSIASASRAAFRVTGLEQLGEVHNRRGTKIRFHPDEQIFGKGAAFEPARLYRMTRSKAYLFGGVEIRWTCDPLADQGQGPDAGEGGVPFPRRPEGLSRAPRSATTSRSPAKSSPARATSRAATARSNGRSPGSAATASSIPTATPSRPAKAAPTRPASATC